MVVVRGKPSQEEEREEKVEKLEKPKPQIHYPSVETIKTQKEDEKKRVEIAKEFRNKPPGRIGRTVHKRSRNFNLEIPEEFRRIVEAEQKLNKDDKEKQIVYTKEGRPLHRPKTQEEQDKELAELLWKVNCIGRLQSQWADWEFTAFKNRVVFYDLCIKISLSLLPVLLLLVIWDYLCAQYFEIPHLSTLTHPGFVIPFHFLAIPCAMYGYMMKVLHFEKSKLTKWGLFCIICHPLILALRCTVELIYNGFRDESKLRYEKYVSGVDDRPDDYDSTFDYASIRQLTWELA